jgi:hypothetical protein
LKDYYLHRILWGALVSVKANLDMSKIAQGEDGKITGLDEQLA